MPDWHRLQNFIRVTKFGWRFLQGQLSFHNGVDSSATIDGDLSIYCPFTASKVQYLLNVPEAFYALLILRFADTDFEMRIAHMGEDDLSDEIRRIIARAGSVATGRFLGVCGDLGKSFGKHAHTELVSIGPWSEYLEIFLEKKYGNDPFNSGGVYYDEEFYALEAELFWPRVWQMACRLEEIPARGMEGAGRSLTGGEGTVEAGHEGGRRRIIHLPQARHHL